MYPQQITSIFISFFMTTTVILPFLAVSVTAAPEFRLTYPGLAPIDAPMQFGRKGPDWDCSIGQSKKPAVSASNATLNGKAGGASKNVPHPVNTTATLACLADNGALITAGWEKVGWLRKKRYWRECGGATWRMTIDWWKSPQRCLGMVEGCLEKASREGAEWALAWRRVGFGTCEVRMNVGWWT